MLLSPLPWKNSKPTKLLLAWIKILHFIFLVYTEPLTYTVYQLDLYHKDKYVTNKGKNNNKKT